MLQNYHRPRKRKLAGFAAAFALHVFLIFLWKLEQTPPRSPADGPRSAMAWIDVRQPAPVRVSPLESSKPKTSKRPRSTPVPMLDTGTDAGAITPEAVPLEQTPATTPDGQTTAITADGILQQARRDIGALDKAMRKESPKQPISAPRTSPQMRLVRGIEAAHDAVPPKWYQGAKIEQIIDPGQYGRKRYKVTTGMGTYCATVESAHSPTAHLDVGKRVEPKLTDCPPNEQAATKQAWE